VKVTALEVPADVVMTTATEPDVGESGGTVTVHVVCVGQMVGAT
jgi:hypothetical protein